ncbi:hypothetical protein TNCV_2867761 [Trichonephila clavipes]|nr:hypothetical protein TNCV_2867761 [Trichonephila clavipes]
MPKQKYAPPRGVTENRKEGRFVLGTFRMCVNASTLLITPRRSSSHDVGTSSYRYHTATYSPVSVLVNRRTNDTIFVGSIRLENCVIHVTAWLLLRWIDGATTRCVKGVVHITTRVTNEGRKVRSGYLTFRTNASTLPITPRRSSSR